MPSRTPFLTSFASTVPSASSSASSSFVSFGQTASGDIPSGRAEANEGDQRRPPAFNGAEVGFDPLPSNSVLINNPANRNTISISTATQSSSLSSSRDEHEHLSYTPIYPSYSSSFSNSSLDLHESLLLAIRERQEQQLLQLHQQQQQHLHQQFHVQHQSLPQQDQHQLAPAEFTNRQESSTMDTPTPHISSTLPSRLTTAITPSVDAQPSQLTQGHRQAGGSTSTIVGDFLQLHNLEFGDLTTSAEQSMGSETATTITAEGSTDAPGSVSALTALAAAASASVAISASNSPPALGPSMPSAPDPFHADQTDLSLSADDQTDEGRALDQRLDSSLPSRLSHLLLAQPLTIHQDHSPSSASDMVLTSLHAPRTPSRQDFDYSSSMGASLDHILHNHGQSDGINGQGFQGDSPNFQYQQPMFETMEQHSTYPASRLALSQVLTSFQDATMSQSFDHTVAPSHAESEAEPMLSTLDTNTISATSPLLPQTHPYAISGRTLSLSVDNLVMLPRGAIPRRRYATRDYSSGSVSSDDWLRHPDVIALNNAEGETAADGVVVQHGEYLLDDVASEVPPSNQDATSSQLVGHELLVDSTPDQNPTTVSPNLDTPMDAPLPLPLFSRPLPTGQLSSRVSVDEDTLSDGVGAIRMDATAEDTNSEDTFSGQLLDVTVDAPITLHSEIESPPTMNATLTDRLGLLGPLLSDSQTVLPLSEEPLDFSLLASNRPGFDSSILSMASRIRQARLTRLLRLLSERDSSMGYADRPPWNRAHPADTRSMINHTGGSRGTSLAGSLDDGQAEVGQETDSIEAAEDRSSARGRDAPILPQFYPVHCPTFAEILDCNGNPIESSSSESYGSSSASSVTSQGNFDEQEDDPDWLGAREQRRRLRRTTLDRNRWNGGDVIRGHGRSRVVSSGTVFEGVEHISEADSLLADNHRYQSLKSSWVTNPNGESWSDDDCDEPNRHRSLQESDDKDLETVSLRRGQPSLGILQPNSGQPHQQQQFSQGGLYYIYGNVRNRYGPEHSRRRRVMTEMSDLLRREREWERELEQYGQEMTAFHSGVASHLATTRPATVGSDSGLGGYRPTMQLPVPVDPVISTARGNDSNSGAPHRNTSFISRSVEGFQDYQQGLTQYHSQGEMTANTTTVTRSGSEDYYQQQQQQQQRQSSFQLAPNGSRSSQVQQTSARQPAATFINRAPPLQPQPNEPITHHTRRANGSSITTQHRRLELLQLEQQQQNLQQQYLQRNMTSASQQAQPMRRDPEPMSRYPGTTYVPPPSVQQIQQHPYQSIPAMPSNGLSGSSGSGVVPQSIGNRSSFRTSHENNGFEHFNLAGSPYPGTTLPPNASAPALPSLVTTTSSSSSMEMPGFRASSGMADFITPSVPSSSTTSLTSLNAYRTDGFGGSGGTQSGSLEPSGARTTSAASPSSILHSSAPTSSMTTATLTAPGASPRVQVYVNNSLYLNHKNGTLRPEERWRRGTEEMVGR
ncbi:hypothetical protein EMPS_07047 [Entomortierella parvispora]|uniref:Uncharacterized protein n=1 Tax=Entomortierella parvispora TaxID=205924 RepID=A0A9P3HDG9_9FUNG|nr:hypothetical protein EMPS_07047 [Entomortierella parvispora]